MGSVTMRRLVVRGGLPLAGSCSIQGSKNIALNLYAATLLMEGRTGVDNAPAILDTGVCVEIARSLGIDAGYDDETFWVAGNGIGTSSIPAEVGRRMRHTTAFAAAALAKTGRITFPTPGGDAFCRRPIDLHLRIMAGAGADIELRGGMVDARLRSARPRPFAASVRTEFGPSLGATVTAVFIAALATGTSVLQDASIEPEVLHTIEFLNRAGARITLLPGRRIEISGVDRLTTANYTVPPDRVEAGTIAIAAGMTGGRVLLTGITSREFTPGFLTWLTATGLHIADGSAGLVIEACSELRPADVVTGPHPDFPTDLQPLATALLTLATGVSRVEENVYSQRTTHVDGLRQFGAQVEHRNTKLLVRGVRRLKPADTHGRDIRAASALLLAALTADGRSTVSGIYHLDRGHAELVEKLTGLGAAITSVDVADEKHAVP
jgi:UDP-N-acetylglucosamine 1-carboxyvinyltransferase